MKRQKAGRSFSVAFNNGEIWYCALDGLIDSLDTQRIFEEEALIMRPSVSSFVICHLYDTKIDDHLTTLANSFKRCECKLKKLAIVGVSSKDRKLLSKKLCDLACPVRFFDDLQQSKEWLI